MNAAFVYIQYTTFTGKVSHKLLIETPLVHACGLRG